MVPDAFFGLISWLYYLCFLLLVALSFFIAFRGGRLNGRSVGSRHARHRARLSRAFLLLALSLLLWQLTLFLETRTGWAAAQLWLGRLNFTSIAVAPYLALRFVQMVSIRNSPSQRLSLNVNIWNLKSLNFWLRLETVLVATVTLLTPLVSAVERVEDGRAITAYGPLFPLYLVHAQGYLVAALISAFRERRRTRARKERCQLTLVGVGMLATGGVACLTNALMPYGFDDFRYCDIGALSTVCFLLAIAYATFLHKLFDLRLALREALVYGCLLAFVLGAYSSIVFVISQWVTDGASKLTQFVVLLIAFSFDPLRRFLEEKTDQLLFGQRKNIRTQVETPDGRRRRSRKKNRLRLMLLFPWRP